MIIGYAISAQDDDSYMLGEDTYVPKDPGSFYTWRFGKDGAPHPATCARCGRKTDPDYVDPNYRVKKRRRDVTATYDGYFLVSDRFRNYCVERQYPGVEFVSLPKDTDFYWLRSARTVRFDTARRQTRFEKFCDSCDGSFDIVGATPVFLKGAATALAEGFYRTDIEFGSGHEQAPILIVGLKTAEELKQLKFVGLELHAIKEAS